MYRERSYIASRHHHSKPMKILVNYLWATLRHCSALFKINAKSLSIDRHNKHSEQAYQRASRGSTNAFHRRSMNNLIETLNYTPLCVSFVEACHWEKMQLMTSLYETISTTSRA